MSNNLKCIHERIGVIKYESTLNLSYYNKFQVNNKHLRNLDERNSIVHSLISNSNSNFLCSCFFSTL